MVFGWDSFPFESGWALFLTAHPQAVQDAPSELWLIQQHTLSSSQERQWLGEIRGSSGQISFTHDTLLQLRNKHKIWTLVKEKVPEHTLIFLPCSFSDFLARRITSPYIFFSPWWIFGCCCCCCLPEWMEISMAYFRYTFSLPGILFQ